MKSKTIKKLYTLHSWVGIITGILLFVIAFTGAVSVFGRPELKMWANPEARAMKPAQTQKIEQLVEQYSVKVPEHYKEEVLIFLPGARGYKYLAIIFESHHGEPQPEIDSAATGEGETVGGTNGETQPKHNPPVGAMFAFDPYTYELVKEKRGLMSDIFAESETDMADFIVDFHADLHLGRPIGLLTTGILGLTMMLSIVTGIFIHRKILGQLFTFRPRKNFSLLLNDGHKVIGVWGLLFNSVIAFTGAFLGLAVVVLVPAAAFVSFGGDQDKLIETFTAVPDPIIQNVDRSTGIASAFEHAFQLNDEIEVFNMTVKGYGDESAMMYIAVAGGDEMARQTAVYDSKGQFVETYSNFARLEGVSGPILDVLFPLHFGNFGGIFVKAIWAILGLGTALLPLTGLMLWLERGVNAANPKYSLKTYQRFNRLVVGGCGGIVAATVLLFHFQMGIKYLSSYSNVGAVIGWPFFMSWLAIIVVAFIVPCERKFAKQLSYVVAFLLMAILPLDLMLTASDMFSYFSYAQSIALGIDITCFAMGVYLFKLVGKFEKQPKTEQTAQLDELAQEGV